MTDSNTMTIFFNWNDLAPIRKIMLTNNVEELTLYQYKPGQFKVSFELMKQET